MSKIEVDQVDPQSGTTLTLGTSGDTVTIPSGVTITNNGTAVNFGATGAASWTTTVKTSTFTAVAGEGYFVDTNGGAITVNLPAGTAGAVVAIKDYRNTFDTNNVTLVANGSDKIGGSTDNKVLRTEGQAVTIIFIDSTRGWLVTDDGLQSSLGAEQYAADFLVIAGGGGGSGDGGAGGSGAGGYRASYNSETSGGGGSSESSINLTPGTVYTITVGNGGAGSATNSGLGSPGGDSSISGSGLTTITSTGGGVGGSGGGGDDTGTSGGSGGGADDGTGASGTANQGFKGGDSDNAGGAGGGGGGAGAVGANNSSNNPGNGGAGVASTITGSSVTRGGGGGAATYNGIQSSGGSGGGGDGGTQTPVRQGTSGTANTGGGAGGKYATTPHNTGGSGVVILRVPTANYSGTTSGSPTVSTDGSDTIMVFNGDGSYTA